MCNSAFPKPATSFDTRRYIKIYFELENNIKRSTLWFICISKLMKYGR